MGKGRGQGPFSKMRSYARNNGFLLVQQGPLQRVVEFGGEHIPLLRSDRERYVLVSKIGVIARWDNLPSFEEFKMVVEAAKLCEADGCFFFRQEPYQETVEVRGTMFKLPFTNGFPWVILGKSRTYCRWISLPSQDGLRRELAKAVADGYVATATMSPT